MEETKKNKKLIVFIRKLIAFNVYETYRLYYSAINAFLDNITQLQGANAYSSERLLKSLLIYRNVIASFYYIKRYLFKLKYNDI